MHEFSRRAIGSAMLVSAVCSSMAAAQPAAGTRRGSTADVCALASNEEVQQLGDGAFFTMIYPDDEYRRRGVLAVFLGPRIVTFSMDPYRDESPDATRPKLEKLAKLVLPRLK